MSPYGNMERIQLILNRDGNIYYKFNQKKFSVYLQYLKFSEFFVIVLRSY